MTSRSSTVAECRNNLPEDVVPTFAPRFPLADLLPPFNSMAAQFLDFVNRCIDFDIQKRLTVTDSGPEARTYPAALFEA